MEKSSKKLLGLALAGVSTLVATTALAAPTVNVSGLGQLDFASFNGDSNDTTRWTNKYLSGGDFRRVKVALNGDLDDVWAYQARWDLTNSRLDDTWLRFCGFEPMGFKLGRQMLPFGMAALTNEADRSFMEVHDTLAVNHGNGVAGNAGASNEAGHGLGLLGEGSTDMIGYHVGVFLPESRSTSGNTTQFSHSDAATWAGRVTFAPSSAEDMVYHLGASYYTGRVDVTDASVGSISRDPMVNIRNNNNTGYINSIGGVGEVEDRHAWGLEAAGEWGPVNAQAEYMRLDYNGKNTIGDASFKEWYAQAGYMLTGESRPYSVANGTFGRVTPASNMGAWELALRYGVTDLSDATAGYTASTTAGKMKDWTFGTNWYANENVAFQFNYINAKATDMTAADRTMNIFALRAQYTF